MRAVNLSLLSSEIGRSQRYRIWTFIMVVLLWSVSSSLFSQGIHFHCKDVETGMGISNVIIEWGDSVGVFKNKIIASSGKALIIGTSGVPLFFKFSAEGYIPLSTYFIPQQGDTLNVEVFLDRTIPLSMPAAEGGVAIYEVWVSDSATASPIEKASIKFIYNEQVVAEGVSDFTGKALLRFNIPYQNFSDDEDVMFGQLIVQKEGYCTVKENYVVITDGTVRFNIALPEAETDCQKEVGSLPGALNGTQLKERPSNTLFSQPALSSGNVSIQGFLNPPNSIRVGTNCSCTSCNSVAVMSLESYVQRGLDNEWISSWHNHSLRSGAIPYRSYGAWHVYNPIRSNYDICSTPCCQAYGSTMYSKTRNAAIYVAGFMLQRSSGSLAKAFYSAENNRGGGTCSSSRWACSDGYAGRPSWTPSFPCILDNVCSGRTGCGHGAGECQWGSQRWASNRGRTWKWIVEHYYSSVNWSISSPLRITTASVSGGGGCITQGCSFNISLNIENASGYDHPHIMIGASLYDGTNWYSDPSNDVNINARNGTHGYSRSFSIPSSVPSGTYDLVVAIWFDVDENNAINTGDLFLHKYTIPNAITVSQTPTSLTATPTCNGTGGISVSFSWNGSASCYNIDISTDPNFSWYYSKQAGSGQSTSGPSGFVCQSGPCPSGYNLSFSGGTTYYWRMRSSCNVISGPSFTTPAQPTASISYSGSCVNSPVLFTATSSGSITSYQWDFGDGGTASGASVQHQYASAGNYTVRLIVTTAQGCKDTAYTTVSLASPPLANFYYTNTSGYTVSFTNTSTNANSWLWDFGDATTSTQQNPVHTYAGPGTYVVSLTATGQCGSDTHYDTITFLSSLSATLDSIVPVRCNGESNGAIFISVSGGQSPYSFSWTNGANSQNLIGAPAGTYSVVINDAMNNTVSVGPITITQPDPLVISLDSIAMVSCFGYSNGSIHISCSGGNGNYSYIWNTGDTSSSLTNLSAGAYTISVYDQKGCNTSKTFNITSPPPLITNIDTSQKPTITANSSGGTPPYSCTWNTGDTSCTILLSSSGTTYLVVTVTDANGCEQQDSSTVTLFQVPSSVNIVSLDCIKCYVRYTGANTIEITCEPHIKYYKQNVVIYSSSGQAVKQYIMPSNRITINTEQFSEGLYTAVIYPYEQPGQYVHIKFTIHR